MNRLKKYFICFLMNIFRAEKQHKFILKLFNAKLNCRICGKVFEYYTNATIYCKECHDITKIY